MDENNNVNDNTQVINDQDNSSVSEEKEKKSEEKMFTQEDVNKMIEKRLRQEKARQEKALKEAERLSKMSEEERIKAEFESERAAFEEEKQAYLKEKMLMQCEKELMNNHLPAEFSKLLVTDNAESTLENIKSFKVQWDKALNNAVNEKLKASSRVPKKETNNIEKIEWEDVLKDPSLLKKYREQENKLKAKN